MTMLTGVSTWPTRGIPLHPFQTTGNKNAGIRCAEAHLFFIPSPKAAAVLR